MPKPATARRRSAARRALFHPSPSSAKLTGRGKYPSFCSSRSSVLSSSLLRVETYLCAAVDEIDADIENSAQACQAVLDQPYAGSAVQSLELGGDFARPVGAQVGVAAQCGAAVVDQPVAQLVGRRGMCRFPELVIAAQTLRKNETRRCFAAGAAQPTRCAVHEQAERASRGYRVAAVEAGERRHLQAS